MKEKCISEVFHDNLVYYASRKGCSQREISQALGVSAAVVNDWFKQKKTPLFDKVDSLCNFLGISRAMLFTERNTMSIDSVNVTAFEKEVLDLFAKLNIDGKNLAHDYVEMLVMSKRYSKDTPLSRKHVG